MCVPSWPLCAEAAMFADMVVHDTAVATDLIDKLGKSCSTVGVIVQLSYL